MSQILVGITGNIASGKSNVLRILRGYDVHTIDADKVAHQLYTPESAVTQQIHEYFTSLGENVLADDGSIDRGKLRPLVIGDTAYHHDNKQVLEDIVNPAIVEGFTQEARQYEGIVGIEAAVLYERGWDQYVDKVILVHCNDEERIDRVLKREAKKENHISREDAQHLIKNYGQWDPVRKLQRSGQIGAYVIETSGTKEQTAIQVKNVYDDLYKLLQKE